MEEIYHYELSQAEKRKIYKTSADYASSALCFNGSAHCKLTNLVRQVNCPICKDIMSNRCTITGAVKSFIKEVIS